MLCYRRISLNTLIDFTFLVFSIGGQILIDFITYLFFFYRFWKKKIVSMMKKVGENCNVPTTWIPIFVCLIVLFCFLFFFFCFLFFVFCFLFFCFVFRGELYNNDINFLLKKKILSINLVLSELFIFFFVMKKFWKN